MCIYLPAAHVHICLPLLDPFQSLVEQELAWRQTRGLDHRSVCVQATGMASQSCSCSWHWCRSTANNIQQSFSLWCFVGLQEGHQASKKFTNQFPIIHFWWISSEWHKVQGQTEQSRIYQDQINKTFSNRTISSNKSALAVLVPC